MTAFVGVFRAHGPTETDRARLAAAARGLGLPGSPTTPRLGWLVHGAGPGASAADAAGAPAAGDPVVARPLDGAAVYVARGDDGACGVSTSARAAAAAAGRPLALDPAGFSGLLWRGAALDHRLPWRDVVAVPAGGAAVARADGLGCVVEAPAAPAPDAAPLDRALADVVAGPDFALLTRGGPASLALLAVRRLFGAPECDAFSVRWPRAEEARVREAGRTARVLGARHHVLDLGDLDPAAALSAWSAAVDVPSAEGFEAHLLDQALARGGVRRVATPAGGAALFGFGEPFLSLARRRRPWLDRSRPPRTVPDPFDVAAHRELEGRALRRVPVHAAQSALALLPAATREALGTTGPRPPDGTARARSAVAAASAAALAALVDRELRAPGPRTWRPFLAASWCPRVRSLPDRVRFGRPGSGGLLRRWLVRARGWAQDAPAEGFEPTLDAWLRGPLAAWLADALAPERLAAQGVWRTDGVARAVTAWRDRRPGWTARVVFVLAALAAWLDRDGLRVAP